MARPLLHSRSPANSDRRTFRPFLEALEGRLTPTITLLGVASFNNTGSVLVGTNPTVDSHGNIYGTTNVSGSQPATLGTVFEVAAASRAISTLASFNGTNGQFPSDNLILDSSGNFYGTTRQGGANNDGTVFELAAGGNSISTLASFNNSNGANVAAGVIEDSFARQLGALPDQTRRLVQLGVRTRLAGDGIVVSQSPEAGAPLERGVECRLVLGRLPTERVPNSTPQP